MKPLGIKVILFHKESGNGKDRTIALPGLTSDRLSPSRERPYKHKPALMGIRRPMCRTGCKVFPAQPPVIPFSGKSSLRLPQFLTQAPAIRLRMQIRAAVAIELDRSLFPRAHWLSLLAG